MRSAHVWRPSRLSGEWRPADLGAVLTHRLVRFRGIHSGWRGGVIGFGSLSWSLDAPARSAYLEAILAHVPLGFRCTEPSGEMPEIDRGDSGFGKESGF